MLIWSPISFAAELDGNSIAIALFAENLDKNSWIKFAFMPLFCLGVIEFGLWIPKIKGSILMMGPMSHGEYNKLAWCHRALIGIKKIAFKSDKEKLNDNESKETDSSSESKSS